MLCPRPSPQLGGFVLYNTVSILIPAYNRLDLTSQCLETVTLYADPTITSEIIVIDDASTDGTADFIRKRYPDIKLVRNARRQSFGASINAAAALATGRYLCLLNNDTLALPNWLGPMVQAAAADPAIGVVGNRQLWPRIDKINHAGMAFDQNCSPVHVHVGQPRDFPPALIAREFQILTAACWVTPKAVFDDLGGFDLQFRNGFEDVDFCLRVRQRNLKVWYVGESVIYHYGQSTAGRMANDVENARRFHRKWRGKIRPDLHEFTSEPPWRAPRQPISAPRPARAEADVHFAIPMETANSFSWVTAELATACQDAGMKVSVSPGKLSATIDRRQRAAIGRMMRRAPSPKFQIRWNHFWRPYMTQALSGEINAEIFAINYRYGPQPRQSLDQWIRHTVVNPYRKLPISQYCADMLADVGVERSQRVLPLGFSPEILSGSAVDKRFSEYQFVFLAVTNCADPFRYGTDILLESYRRAFAGRKDVLLAVTDYGKGQSPIEAWVRSTAEAAPVAYLKDFVAKEDLIALYRRANAFVAPFRGEGFGMKIIDACALGLPVIAPRYGGPRDYLRSGSFYPVAFREVPVGDCLDAEEGLVPPYALWCEPDGDDLCAQMIAAASDRQRGREMGSRAKSLVLENFSWPSAATRLAQALADFSRERDVAAASRASVVSKALSVVIPTFRRPAALRKTLEAYQRQSADKNDWEIVVVDDGSGAEFRVEETVRAFSSTLPIKFVAQAVNSGPGQARETAMPLTVGEVILFTGDDIVPDRNLIGQHLSAHRGLGSKKAAVLGYIGWDKDIEVSELMDFITSEGGYQFFYRSMTPYHPVRPEYFYTSNVSVRRSFLASQETIFDSHFAGYGSEDAELGLRLAGQGMILYFNPDAYGFHNHPMSDESIYRRQYNIGRSQILFSLLQPQTVDEERSRLFQLFELLQFAAPGGGPLRAAGAETESFASLFARLGLTLDPSDELTDRLREALTAKSGKMRGLAASLTEDLDAARRRLLFLRLELAQLWGMADEWLEPNVALNRYEFCEAWARLDALSPAGGPPESSDLLRRLKMIESIRSSHPAAASALRTVVRLATGVAKRIDSKSRRRIR